MEGWLNSLSKIVTVKNKRMKWNEMKWKWNKEQQIKGMGGTGRKKDWKRGKQKRDLMFRLPINDLVSNLLAPLVEIATSSLP